MSKCENCIHFDMCAELIAYYHKAKKEQVVFFMCEDETEKLNCPHFKDKSLIVEFKCKLGQIVYAIVSPEKINKVKVKQIEIVPCEDKTYVHYRVGKCAWFYEEEIGKTVFLTKEDAERKLQEMRCEG